MINISLTIIVPYTYLLLIISHLRSEISEANALIHAAYSMCLAKLIAGSVCICLLTFCINKYLKYISIAFLFALYINMHKRNESFF